MPARTLNRTRSRERELTVTDLTLEFNRIRGLVNLLQRQINELQRDLSEEWGELRSDLSELSQRVAALDGGPAPPVCIRSVIQNQQKATYAL